MRKPTIHITEDSLVKILDSIDIRDVSISAKKLAREILVRSKTHSIIRRNVFLKNDKSRKRVSRLLLSETKDAVLFSKLTYTMRRLKKHRGINITKEGSRDWINVKECTKLAIDFCNDFNLSKNAGFKKYAGLGLNKMKNFSWPKFNSLHQAICVEYEAILLVEEDITPNTTAQACKIYEQILMEKTGIQERYEDSPEKYRYFIDVVQECKGLNVRLDIYIKAQFAGLEWANSYPDPPQLVGIKSIGRLQKYLLENEIKLKPHDKPHSK